MALGALAWFVGCAVWLAGGAVFRAAGFWIAFIVLTIAGERLELSRLVPRPRRARFTFVPGVAATLAGPAVALVAPAAGGRVLGAGLLALAAWLARWDAARRTVRTRGLPRYSAVALLAGYVWLAAGGALALAEGALLVGPRYDAVLHATFLGFAFSMIFAHAPTVLPAVLGVPVPFRRRFYAHLALLHASVALRLAGDLAARPAVRAWSGEVSAGAIALFAASTALAVRTRARSARTESPSS
jgi:hypothetical protein